MELRASAAPIWAECPGSVGLKKIESGDTPASLEGDLCHLLAFLYLTEGLSIWNSADVINSNPKFKELNGTGLLVTEEYIELAKGAALYCKSVGATWTDTFKCEQFVKGGTLPLGVQGTLDFSGYNPPTKILHIIDFKFGFGSVQAVKNWQLLVYSIGAMDIFYNNIIDEIHLHIYQPRDFVNGAVKVWKLDREEWEAWKRTLLRREKLTRTQPASKTGSHCRYCPSRVFCTAFLDSVSYVLETVQTNPESNLYPSSAIGAELAYLKRASALVDSALKAFEDLAISEIEAGKPVPGWTLGRSSGKRFWTASLEDIQAVEKLINFKLTEEKPISVSAATKNKKILPLIESLMSKSEGKQKLIPFDGDKTKEIFNNE